MGLESTPPPQRGSAELSGGSATSCEASNLLTPPSNSAMVEF